MKTNHAAEPTLIDRCCWQLRSDYRVVRGFFDQHWRDLKSWRTDPRFGPIVAQALLHWPRVVVMTVLAVAALTLLLAWPPALRDEAAMPAGDAQSAPSSGVSDKETSVDSARAALACAQCGIVESTREIVDDLENGDSGATAAGDKKRRKAPPLKSVKGFEVTVRMKDGASHQFMAANSANWRPGERVVFIDRKITSDE
jgi:hypothetical protein